VNLNDRVVTTLLGVVVDFTVTREASFVRDHLAIGSSGNFDLVTLSHAFTWFNGTH